MACSYVLSLSGREFSSNGVYYYSITPNFNANGLSDRDIEGIDCDSMLFGYKGNLSINGNSPVSHYGFRLTCKNVLSGDCGAVFDWYPLLRINISWRPQFKDTEGNSYSVPFSKEYNNIADSGSPFSVHSVYDSNNLVSYHNIGFDVPSGSQLYNDFQALIDRFLGDKGKFFDRYTYTPSFSVKELGIYKNFGCVGGVGLFNYVCDCDEPDCFDSRSSDDEQNIHFIISDGESNITELDVPFLLSEGSTQEKAIKTYMNDTLYNSLINLYNLNHNVMARCSFNAGVVRSSCTVRLVGKVYGQSVCIKPSTTPPFVQFDYDVVGGTDVDILKAEFEPCSDNPVRITEDLRAFLQGLNVKGDLSLGFNLYQVLPYKVVIENCTALNNFCCDDSVPSDNDSITIEPTEGLIQIYGGTQGGSSGGDDVNIQCICDNLNSINNTLLAFKESNQTTLEAISNTLSELDINVDNTCVCDNLQTVSDSIIAVKDSIDNKELSVVNNNTVQPPVNNVVVQPPVNNVSVQPPVNNVSVQPPVNNVSLPTTQLENISNNTRSLNNIFDELVNMNVVQSNIGGYVGNIKDSLECGNKGIACVLAEKTISVDVDVDNAHVTNGLQDISDKLSTLNDNVHDSLFNSDDESNLENINKSLNTTDDESKNIADVINDKEMGTNIDVEVSPADDVNINRVYYTNQKNGDTNL